jgi:hypothetical protein
MARPTGQKVAQTVILTKDGNPNLKDCFAAGTVVPKFFSSLSPASLSLCITRKVAQNTGHTRTDSSLARWRTKSLTPAMMLNGVCCLH